MSGASGFWSVSSSIDFCEPNFVYSPYIAELWNTVSNVPIIILCVVCYVRSGRVLTKQPGPARTGYLWLLAVFVGSFLFHATLTYTGQLMDELPMIGGVISFHLALDSVPSTRILSRSSSTAAHMGAAVALAVAALMYLLRSSPLPLQLSYGFLTVALVLRSVRAYSLVSPTARRILLTAMVLYGSGFALWLTEQAVCPAVRPFKFHALWHILTGVGTLGWIQFLTAHLIGSDSGSLIVLLNGALVPGLLPFVVRRRHPRSDAWLTAHAR